MLKSVVIENFEPYRERTSVDFSEGSNFIIGGNGVGKSKLFELIRRCYSREINKTSSPVCDEGKIAYVVCKFDPTSVPEQGQEIQDLLACFIKKDEADHRILGLKRKDEESYHFAKFVSPSTQSENDTIKTSIDRVWTQNDITDLRRAKVCSKLIESILENAKESQLPAELCGGVFNAIAEFLTKAFVIVLALRSIGPIQWSKSKKLHHDNYQAAHDKAEILSTLLESDKDDTDEERKDVDREVEKRYFQAITSPSDINYEEVGGRIYMNLTRDDGKKRLKVELLKSPEGPLEAKQLSLILAHTKYKTILLEEPDHGMHPQMLENMRNMVLKKVKGKTVLIISHHPSLINRWAMKRTYRCFRKERGSCIERVDGVYAVYGCGQFNELRDALFSSYVLLVEGESDRIFIEALFDVHLEKSREKAQEKPTQKIKFNESRQDTPEALHDDDERCPSISLSEKESEIQPESAEAMDDGDKRCPTLSENESGNQQKSAEGMEDDDEILYQRSPENESENRQDTSETMHEDHGKCLPLSEKASENQQQSAKAMEDDVDEIGRQIAKVKIVCLNGADKRKKFVEFCDKFDIKYMFVLDRDKADEVWPVDEAKEGELKNKPKELIDWIETGDNWKELLKKTDKRYFFWKFGAIEKEAEKVFGYPVIHKSNKEGKKFIEMDDVGIMEIMKNVYEKSETVKPFIERFMEYFGNC